MKVTEGICPEAVNILGGWGQGMRLFRGGILKLLRLTDISP